MNPEYKYEFFDDSDCREFIKTNFEIDVLDSFDLLNPGAYKADLFRLCYIYINGGCYVDNKYILRIPFRNLITKDLNNIYCKDRGPDLMFNSIIFSVKKTNCIKKCIDDIVSNVKNNYYGKCPLFPTGPGLLNKHALNENILLLHSVNGKRSIEDKNYLDSRIIIKDNNKIFINTFYKGYYNNAHDLVSYTRLYNKREVYYKNMIKKENLIFLIYPNSNNDVYDFFEITDKSFKIQRVDSNSGWGEKLKIRIINNLDNKSKLIEVGNSFSNILHVSF